MSGDLSAISLYYSDSLLKSLPIEKYSKTASDESIEKTKKSLEEKYHKCTIVNNKKEALELIKKLIPKGSSVMNAGSMTLIEIGFIKYLKGETEWDNLHAKIFGEKDFKKQIEMRRKSTICDYFISSVSAITETGEIVVCDRSGSRVGPIIYGPANVILVVGSNKIVPNYEDAIKRAEEYCLPLESARARIVFSSLGIQGSEISNLASIKVGNPFQKERIHIIIIKESLGY